MALTRHPNSVLFARHRDPQRLRPIPRYASSCMIAILLDSGIRSVSIGVDDHSSSSSENTRFDSAAICFADSFHRAARHFDWLHGVRLPRIL